MRPNPKHRGGSAASARGGGRFAAIDGIRGLAALGLLTVHVAMFSGLLGTKALGPERPPSNFVGAFLVSGLPSFIGVFFVLPAMFLYLPLAKAIIADTPRPPQGKGFLRRLLRLLPAYYVMYLVVLLTLNRDAIDGFWYVLRPILLLQVYLPSPFVPHLMNGMEITWTVPTMVQWYAILPLIAWAVHRFAARGATPEIRARRLMLPVPILIAIGVAWLFVVKGNGWDNRIVFWWPQGFAPTIGIGMALAITLALSQVSPDRTPRLLRVAVARPTWFWLGALAVYLVNCARPFSVIGMDAIYSTTGLLVTYLMVALFGLLAVTPLIATGGTGGSRPMLAVLTSRPVVHVGRVSYGIYLWHFAVMHFYLQPEAIVSGHARPLREHYGTAGFWQLELVTVAGAVLLATLSYHLLELPISAWGEKFLGDRGRPNPPRTTSPPVGTGSWTTDEAAAASAAAAAEHAAIRSNLLDLEASPGARLLSGAHLTGVSSTRCSAARNDLARLWEIFTTYSAVLDQAQRTLAGNARPSAADLATINGLLTGRSVPLHGTPVPLVRRHIADTGDTRLTPDEAVSRMNELFGRTAELVTTVETVRNEVTARLDEIAAELGRARERITGLADGAGRAALAAAEADLHRYRNVLDTDPLSVWVDGRVDGTGLDRLRQDIAAVVLGRAEGRDGGEERLAG